MGLHFYLTAPVANDTVRDMLTRQGWSMQVADGSDAPFMEAFCRQHSAVDRRPSRRRTPAESGSEVAAALQEAGEIAQRTIDLIKPREDIIPAVDTGL